MVELLATDAGQAALGAPWSLVALGACAALVACIVLIRHTARPATIAWAVPFAAIAASLASWCARGLCLIGAQAFCFFQLVLFLLGLVVLQRDRIAVELGALAAKGGRGHIAAEALRWTRDAALLAVASWLSFVALEAADNPSWRLIDPVLTDQGLMLVVLACAALYFLGQRHGALCILVPVACAVFGLVQNFLNLFKNTALLPSDVMAWQTAAAVSGGYTYELPAAAIACIISAAAAIAALAYIQPARRPGPSSSHDSSVPIAAGADPQRRTSTVEPNAGGPVTQALPDNTPSRRRWARKVAGTVTNIACCAACTLVLWNNVSSIDYQEEFDIYLDYWDLRNSYNENGFLVSFIAAAQDLIIDVPQGYTDEGALQLQAELARQYDESPSAERSAATEAFDRSMPSIIAIMNESYANLSIFEKLGGSYEGTFVTRKLDAPESGWLNMSVHGGGTCNSEYEFLAGSSMAFMGSGMYPYQQFSFANLPTLPSQLARLGYETWAMHPNYPGNWNRELVFATMGINTSLFIYDFEGADEFHTHVSDRATYDRALKILNDSDKPKFILDITMQNHSGYDTGSVPRDQSVDVRPSGLDAAAIAELDEYLGCIQESDRALEHLMAQLEALDEPVAVVFFGDHQPALSRDLNDALFPDEGDLDHKARITKTPYFIWTNYEIGASPAADGAADGDADAAKGFPGSDDPGMAQSSANYLAAQLLEYVGAPLSDYQKALLVLRRQLPAVNTNGFYDANGTWHEASEGQAEDHPYHQLQVLHYLNVVRNL